MNEETKPIWQSKTVLASAVVVIVSLLLTTGIIGSGDVDATEVTDHLWSIVTGVMGIIGIIGRVVASKKISKPSNTNAPVWLLAGLLFIGASGCSGVMLNTAYKQQLGQAVVITQELSRRCQAGDPNACEIGCVKAATTLQLLYDASNGKAGE